MKCIALGCKVGRTLITVFVCYFACTAEEAFFNFCVEDMVAFHVCFFSAICILKSTSLVEFLNSTSARTAAVASGNTSG